MASVFELRKDAEIKCINIIGQYILPLYDTERIYKDVPQGIKKSLAAVLIEFYPQSMSVEIAFIVLCSGNK